MKRKKKSRGRRENKQGGFQVSQQGKGLNGSLKKKKQYSKKGLKETGEYP